jgi:hypothetical protein
MTRGPIEIFDADGVTRLKGTSEPAIPSATDPVQAYYTGDPLSIANNTQANLPWTDLAGGTELLDRTDPANPTFLEDGTYAVTLNVVGDALTANGYATAILYDDTLTIVNESLHPNRQFGVTAVVVAAAGDGLVAAVHNFDGASARSFSIDTAVVVKL